jgi:putative transposase
MSVRLPGGRRLSIRLPTHDYSGGAAYLVTLCTYERAHLFGKVIGRTVQLTAIGRIVYDRWLTTPGVRPGVALDSFVVMPNHMHAIVWMPRSGGSRSPCVLTRPPRSLGSLVAGYKAACTSRVRVLIGSPEFKVWQRNYHERVIRDSRALYRMRLYISANPVRWAERDRTRHEGGW